ncbi:MAG: hypothetical protein OMOMHJEC_02969 [Xanthomonadales bacterium]|nr:hypothetical protein [Xanthomonadales bacterium]
MSGGQPQPAVDPGELVDRSGRDRGIARLPLAPLAVVVAQQAALGRIPAAALRILQRVVDDAIRVGLRQQRPPAARLPVHAAAEGAGPQRARAIGSDELADADHHPLRQAVALVVAAPAPRFEAHHAARAGAGPDDRCARIAAEQQGVHIGIRHARTQAEHLETVVGPEAREAVAPGGGEDLAPGQRTQREHAGKGRLADPHPVRQRAAVPAREAATGADPDALGGIHQQRAHCIVRQAVAAAEVEIAAQQPTLRIAVVAVQAIHVGADPHAPAGVLLDLRDLEIGAAGDRRAGFRRALIEATRCADQQFAAGRACDCLDRRHAPAVRGAHFGDAYVLQPLQADAVGADPQAAPVRQQMRDPVALAIHQRHRLETTSVPARQPVLGAGVDVALLIGGEREHRQLRQALGRAQLAQAQHIAAADSRRGHRWRRRRCGAQQQGHRDRAGADWSASWQRHAPMMGRADRVAVDRTGGARITQPGRSYPRGSDPAVASQEETRNRPRVSALMAALACGRKGRKGRKGAQRTQRMAREGGRFGLRSPLRPFFSPLRPLRPLRSALFWRDSSDHMASFAGRAVPCVAHSIGR